MTTHEASSFNAINHVKKWTVLLWLLLRTSFNCSVTCQFMNFFFYQYCVTFWIFTAYEVFACLLERRTFEISFLQNLASSLYVFTCCIEFLETFLFYCWALSIFCILYESCNILHKLFIGNFYFICKFWFPFSSNWYWCEAEWYVKKLSWIFNKCHLFFVFFFFFVRNKR